MRESKKVDSVLENAGSLRGLSETFSILDELNKILHRFLPKHLVKYCHIGAVDVDKNLVVLYLSDSTLKHIIEGMASAILDNFNNHHFSFSGLVTRIRPNGKAMPARRKYLEPKALDKLEQLAQSINRPDLIEDEVVMDNEKEIEF